MEAFEESFECLCRKRTVLSYICHILTCSYLTTVASSDGFFLLILLDFQI